MPNWAFLLVTGSVNSGTRKKPSGMNRRGKWEFKTLSIGPIGPIRPIGPIEGRAPPAWTSSHAATRRSVAAATAPAASVAAGRRSAGAGALLHDPVAAGDDAPHRLTGFGVVGEGGVVHALPQFKTALFRAESLINVRWHSRRLTHGGAGSKARALRNFPSARERCSHGSPTHAGGSPVLRESMGLGTKNST